MEEHMTRLFLIRHGETTDLETKKIYKGSLDIPLSDRGRERLGRVSSYLSDKHIHHVYTSALSRAVESGTIIARVHGLSIESIPALNEINFGLWEGLSFDEISAQYPTELDLWIRDPEVHSPPEGEPLRQAQERIMTAIHGMGDAHRGQNVAIVAHGGTLRIIICTLLQVKLSNLFKIGQDHGCINIVDLHENGNVTIQLLNFTVSPEPCEHNSGQVPGSLTDR
jgi:alpha-ribazole phosphatase